MIKVLVVVPPLTGHVNPTVPLGIELEARGHEVAWAGLPGVVDRLLPPGARFHPLAGSLDRAAFERMQDEARGLRGPQALKFLWEGFLLPLASATAPELLRLVEHERPDVLVVDQQAVAGAVVARQARIPWVTSATTSAELTDPLAALPKVDAWVRQELVDLQLGLGVAPDVATIGDLRFSDELVLAFTAEALFGPATGLPAAAGPVRWVGPSIDQRPEPSPFPWEWLDPARRRVLVSLGTVNAEVGDRFFATAVEALSGPDSRPDLQVVVVAPPDRVALPPDTDRIRVFDRVPQLALLPHLDAVVSHGGHNTVCEALAHGLPLVLAPIRDDQPIVADQVVRAGAGIRVRFGRVGPTELRAAVDDVLDTPTFRAAALGIARSFQEAGGAAAAADAVEALVNVEVPT
jgi:UDP:flavonoid glycosyltransferase YjiC (YdhE family)